MMRSVPLVAVVGALLVGGAATGTTYAQWVKGSNLTSNTARSGAMSFTASANPTSISVPAGGSATSRVTLTDTSDTAAKNLRQRLTPTLSGTLPTGVTAALRATVAGGSCGTGTQGAVDLAPGGSFTTCVRVTAAAGSSGTATLSVASTGAQVRGGTVSGWTSPTRTVAIPVTVTATITPPTLSCNPGRVAGNNFEFSWSSVSGAIDYTVRESTTTNTAAAYSDLATVTGTSYTHTSIPDGTRFYRVQVTTSAGTSGDSNTIRVVRSGNGSSAYSCSVVTP